MKFVVDKLANTVYYIKILFREKVLLWKIIWLFSHWQVR